MLYHEAVPALLPFAALVALLSTPAAQAPEPLQTRPCTEGTARLASLCGTFRVYEDRTAGSGRTIALNFVVIKAARPTNRAIVWNPGGPGAASTGAAGDIADGKQSPELRRLHDAYDILLVDNRGTGGSAIQQCDFSPRSQPARYFAQIWPDELVQSCRTRLGQDANLSLYGTSIAADDLDALRAALGYPKLVLDGGSYGTRFYLEYARRHPSSVESMILDGVAPPYFLVIPLEDAAGAESSVRRLIAQCGSDALCRAHFPAFGPHFDALVRRFDRGPVRVPLQTGKNQRVVVALSKEVFAERLRQLLYSPEGAAYVPVIVERAYQGDYAPLATMVDVVTQGFAQLVATGLNLSVTCAEDIPFITQGQVTATSAHSFEGDLRVRAQQRACRIWNVKPVAAAFYEPVRSNAPILMISGTDDPASPPQFAREALPYLPNARILLLKNASHGTETACSDRLKVEFVRAGGAQQLDLAACAGAFHRPPFATSMAGFGD
jgi:pimeloyl-ACP methyl ester carboxylesterase